MSHTFRALICPQSWSAGPIEWAWKWVLWFVCITERKVPWSYIQCAHLNPRSLVLKSIIRSGKVGWFKGIKVDFHIVLCIIWTVPVQLEEDTVVSFTLRALKLKVSKASKSGYQNTFVPLVPLAMGSQVTKLQRKPWSLTSPMRNVIFLLPGHAIKHWLSKSCRGWIVFHRNHGPLFSGKWLPYIFALTLDDGA